MPNLNEVRLMGNLTREPEVKYTPKGTAVCTFGLAINRTWLDDQHQKHEETTFIDVEFWGKKGEAIAQYVKKGHPLYVAGRLKLDQWDDKQTGQKRSKLSVVGEDFQFLKNKEGGHTPSNPEEEAHHGAPSQQRPATPPRPPVDPSLDAPEEDDIPF